MIDLISILPKSNRFKEIALRSNQFWVKAHCSARPVYRFFVITVSGGSLRVTI